MQKHIADARSAQTTMRAGAVHREMWSRNFSSGGGAKRGVIAVRRD
jgi:hypothetical protein